MRCYVAASSKDIARAESVMAELRALGCEVVSTWPEAIRAANAAGFPHDRDLPTLEMRHHAETDLRQVQSADLFLLLASEIRSTGAGVEFGYAHCLSYQVGQPVVIGAGPLDSVFYSLAAAWFDTDAAAIEFVREKAEGWGRG